MAGRERSHKIWNANHPEDPIKTGDGCVIHHIDGNHNNDDPSNHRKMTRKAHGALHHTGRPISEEQKRQVSKVHKGKIVSEETRRKIGLSKIGNKNSVGLIRSAETRKKISDAQKGRIPWNKDKHLSKEHKEKIAAAITLRFSLVDERIKQSRRMKEVYAKQ